MLCVIKHRVESNLMSPHCCTCMNCLHICRLVRENRHIQKLLTESWCRRGWSSGHRRTRRKWSTPWSSCMLKGIGKPSSNDPAETGSTATRRTMPRSWELAASFLPGSHVWGLLRSTDRGRWHRAFTPCTMKCCTGSLTSANQLQLRSVHFNYLLSQSSSRRALG